MFEMSTYETVSILVQVVGFSLIIVPLFMAYRQIQSRVFCDYTARYAEIFPDLQAALYAVNAGGGFQNCKAMERDGLRLEVARYLNMCSEEFHLNENRFLHRSTWKVWDRGMDQALDNEDLRYAVASILTHYSFFEKFQSFIQSKIDAKALVGGT
ncbi:MAG: hypothetical protein AAFN79_06720 [Pseudomonadota bacterium]